MFGTGHVPPGEATVPHVGLETLLYLTTYVCIWSRRPFCTIVKKSVTGDLPGAPFNSEKSTPLSKWECGPHLCFLPFSLSTLHGQSPGRGGLCQPILLPSPHSSSTLSQVLAEEASGRKNPLPQPLPPPLHLLFFSLLSTCDWASTNCCLTGWYQVCPEGPGWGSLFFTHSWWSKAHKDTGFGLWQLESVNP